MGEVRKLSDVLIRDAARELCAVEAVARDYALDVVSLEREELGRLVDEVRSGRRVGLSDVRVRSGC